MFRKTLKKYKFNKNSKIIIHIGENTDVSAYINMWYNSFKESEVSFSILTRHKKVYDLIKTRFKNESIIYAKNPTDINNIFKALPLKAIFYLSNTGNNMHTLKYNNLKHVFIGHGDSDKTASAHKFFRIYDENWVAGEAHIDRFRNAGFNYQGLVHKKVGRPTLKENLKLSSIQWKKRFPKLNIAYLSTWEGVFKEQDYSSIYIIKDIFKYLNQYDFIEKLHIKYHPRLGSTQKEIENIKQDISNLSTKYKKEIFEAIYPVNEIIKQSNLFITDISAVITECLSVNSPIFVYYPKNKNIKLSKTKYSLSDYTYTFSNLKEFKKKFEEVILNNNDFLANNREKAIDYFLSKDLTLNNVFIKEIRKIAK
ncbi:hypothetical protein [Caminibacter pacificus]|nr:hypothetical protein [Caminibacter pacificus]QDD68119.1 hypothetical protein C6V80_09720 [Caminibacter pacificus]